MVMFAVDRFKR